jgi:hypothetical protein
MRPMKFLHRMFQCPCTLTLLPALTLADEESLSECRIPGVGDLYYVPSHHTEEGEGAKVAWSAALISR